MIDESALKQIVRDSMGMSDLNESYATQAKKFDLNTELLSSDQKKEHQKLFENYVKVLNEVSVKIDAQNWSDAASEHSEYRQLKLDETYNLNAAFLHGLYFDNISDVRSQIAMDSLTFLRLERDFGGFSAWQKDFIACCMSSRNGWVVTVYSTLVNRYMNVVVDLHSTGVPFGAIPIIAMASGYDLLKFILADQYVDWGALFLGAGLSFASAILCIHGFLILLNRVGMMPFVIYRLLLGCALFYILAGA